MTKKLENPTKLMSKWSEAQLAQLEAIILEHKEAGRCGVRWGDYAASLGHSLKSCYAMSHVIRNRLRTRQRQEYRERIRLIVDGEGVIDGRRSSLPVKLKQPQPPKPKQLLDEERVNTSTQRLRFTAEMLSRIGPQGVTAGLLGDPIPGHSALDEKHGRSTWPKPKKRKNDHPRFVPTLATQPMRF